MKSPRVNRRRAGFTLLEVMLAVGLMVLIGGAVMAIVRTTFESIAILGTSAARRQEVIGLLDLLTTTFRRLPGDGQVLLQPEAGGVAQESMEVAIRNAPDLFAFGNESMNRAETMIRLRRTAGKYQVLGIARREQGNSESSFTTGQDQNLVWLPLVGEIEELRWRFYNQVGGQWLDNWRNPDARPTLVELTLKLAEDPTPIRSVFWIPPVDPPPAPPQFPSGQSGQPGQAGQPVAGQPGAPPVVAPVQNGN